jgi:hypothetical protein
MNLETLSYICKKYFFRRVLIGHKGHWIFIGQTFLVDEFSAVNLNLLPYINNQILDLSESGFSLIFHGFAEKI